MSGSERAFCVDVDGTTSVAILHEPAALGVSRGVVIVVGGPQYRVGSHRQFVLLARELAARGIAVLRFDLPGMGDSGGDPAGFEGATNAIRVAIDTLLQSVAGVRSVCLWGLCDGASAAVMYGAGDSRVTDLVLANPWVRSEAGLAQSYIDSYYGRRLRSGGFWRKIVREPLTVPRAAGEFLANLWRARGTAPESGHGWPAESFLDRMLRGAECFEGRSLVLLSGRDLVATEFELALQRWPKWARAFSAPRVQFARHPDANHTFSRRVWRDWVTDQTAEFLRRTVS